MAANEDSPDPMCGISNHGAREWREELTQSPVSEFPVLRAPYSSPVRTFGRNRQEEAAEWMKLTLMVERRLRQLKHELLTILEESPEEVATLQDLYGESDTWPNSLCLPLQTKPSMSQETDLQAGQGASTMKAMNNLPSAEDEVESLAKEEPREQVEEVSIKVEGDKEEMRTWKTTLTEDELEAHEETRTRKAFYKASEGEQHEQQREHMQFVHEESRRNSEKSVQGRRNRKECSKNTPGRLALPKNQ